MLDVIMEFLCDDDLIVFYKMGINEIRETMLKYEIVVVVPLHLIAYCNK